MTSDDARDVREGGAWTRAQRWKNDALYVAIRAALAVVAPLPAAGLRVVGRLVGLVALALFRSARRTAAQNLALAFPEAPQRERRAILVRTYAALGGHLGDALAALDARTTVPPLAIDDADLAKLRDARGVVFASAHLGPWERVAATLVARGVPFTALARAGYDPRLDALYARLRDARGVRTIYRGRRGAASRIVRALRRGGVLGVPMDLRSRVPSVDAPFLGRVAPTPVGPARIALRTGARVVVGTVAPDPRSPEGLRITCTEIVTDDLASATGVTEDAARALTERINDELSRRIRALPTEWPWMHPRFAPRRSAEMFGGKIAAFYDGQGADLVH
jgi:KDO2-lipid IV(A) lauroyltransferase